MHSTDNPQACARNERTLRSYLRWIYICGLHYSGLLALAKLWVRSQGAVVLTFHRVVSDQAAAQTCSPAGLIVRESTFESLLRFVTNHYSIFDLGTGSPIGGADRVQLAITFDDGWEDNASTAFPIASKLGVPFTIFICPELMDTASPFWPEQIIALFRSADDLAEGINQMCGVLSSCGYPEWAMALAGGNGDRCEILTERLKSISSEERHRILRSLLSGEGSPTEGANCAVDRTMSWSQALELQRAGITFGSHTLRHEILTVIPATKAEHEIRGSKAAIEERVGVCSVFSYPNGDVSPEVRDIVARCGYKQAFINSPGVWRKSDSPFLVPRINLSEGTVTGPDGHFSSLAFEYRVFWNAFVHRTYRARLSSQPGTIPTASTVEKFNTL